MLFNSIDFLFFFIAVTLLYFALPHKYRWFLLLTASCYFYMAFVPIYILILGFTIVVDYFAGILLENEKGSKRKMYLVASMVANIGVLAIFKYYNFFAASFAVALQQLGLHVSLHTLNIILPVGISFYTFHGLSYILDVYHRKINAEKDFTAYALFVSFFPLLVAGPIERATHLLPQLKKQRNFYYQNAADGLRQMIWGFFKKIVIADQCAGYVSNAFNHTSVLTGSTLAAGAILFAIQIYADFSGYSDIALGTARLFGIELLRNFAFPYFSKNMAEFWRRWNISLSSWFRDYVYIPLGGSRVSTAKKIRNVFIIFLLSGLWHGANWTFVVWGGLHGFYLWVEKFIDDKTGKIKALTSSANKTITGFIYALFTFFLVNITWVFFRANSFTKAADIFKSMFGMHKGEPLLTTLHIVTTAIIIFFMLIIQWLMRSTKVLDVAYKMPWWLLGIVWSVLLLLLIWSQESSSSFIYFQF